jgi:hypothetical protein
MSPSKPPALAPPGAGLPLPELLIARLLFAIRCRTGSSFSFTQRFIEERKAIDALIASSDPSSLAQQVLIQRPPGLEDSSRDWSVLMTLDHLRIVHNEFARIIRALANESMPQGKASTAAVKPNPSVTQNVIPLYHQSCDELLNTLASVTHFKTKTKFPHPWFGPMDAHAWHALTGGHMSIHRIQIERILKGLGA